MTNPRQPAAVTLPNATPVVLDISNFDDTITVAAIPGSGTDVVKCEVSASPNAAANAASGGPVNWFPCVATGLTAGATAAGVAVLFQLTGDYQAMRFTRTAGTGVSVVELCG